MIIKKTEFENYPSANSLEFDFEPGCRNNKCMVIESANSLGDVEIETSDGYGNNASFFLNQEALKELIIHLQKQVK